VIVNVRRKPSRIVPNALIAKPCDYGRTLPPWRPIVRHYYSGKATELSTELLDRNEARIHSHISQAHGHRTAVDLVPLGRDGPSICRLGIGTGTEGGAVQRALGTEGFNRLIRHAYDRGITFIDTADMYETHTYIRDAVKGLPRENLWIQTKMRWDNPAPPERPLEVLDRFLTELDMDYVDSLLIHCATIEDWDEQLKPMMDAFAEAKARKLIRLHGISCHGLPALRNAIDCNWVEVQLARVNPLGRHIDGADGTWDEPGLVPEAMQAIQAMHQAGRGVIGMKLVGGGHFRSAEDRERSAQYAMKCGFVDSVVVGFASPSEIDETIDRLNRALA